MQHGIAVVIILAVAACASGRSGATLLSDWQPPEGQTCEVASSSGGLPAVGSVIDSTALAQALRRTPMSSRGYALFSLEWDTAGTWEHVVPIESDMSQAAQDDLTRILKAHLRTPPPDGAFRFLIDLGEPLRFAVGNREACPPALRNA